MEQKRNKDSLDKGIIAQYLISEFEMLHQRAEAHERFIANKTNFFVGLTTATLGGLLFLLKESVGVIASLSITVVGFFALIFLLIVGWVIFKQSVDMVASAAIYYRRAGRVRRWFVDNAPSVEKYIPFTVTDERPLLYVPYAPLRDFNTIVASVNAGLMAILGNFILFIGAFHKLSLELSIRLMIVMGLILFGAMFYLQFRVYKTHLVAKEQSEKERGKVHFPQSDT